MLPHRIERVSEAIRETLSKIIHDNLRDPGIPAVFTLTNVLVSRDLRHAHIQFSLIPDDEASVAAAMAALERAKGFLRRELGAGLQLKYLPLLEFHYDPSPRHAQRIHELLGTLHTSSPPDSSAPASNSSASTAPLAAEPSSASGDSLNPAPAPARRRKKASAEPSAVSGKSSDLAPAPARRRKKASGKPDSEQ